MKVYLAGPMRGYPQYNFPAFHDGARRLRACGHRVISPAEMDTVYAFDVDTDSVTDDLVRSFVRRDVEALTLVDAAVVLPGWEESKGATAEVAVAGWLGIPVFDLAEMIADA